MGASTIVILTPDVGRRISRNISGLIAASWLLDQNSRETAGKMQLRLMHSGRSFGPKPCLRSQFTMDAQLIEGFSATCLAGRLNCLPIGNAVCPSRFYEASRGYEGL